VKVKDITEGLYDIVSMIGQARKAKAWDQGGAEKWYAKNTPPTPPTSTPQVPNPQEGSVLLVTAANGEQYFKSYKGTWHVKGSVPQEFSVGGTKITDPSQITQLDKLLSQAKLIGVKPDPKDNTGQAFLYDQRKTALLAKRSGKK
jgi:hypothetical protein